MVTAARLTVRPGAGVSVPPAEVAAAHHVALHQVGWRITYLGADTPVAMTEEVAAHVAPDLVVVFAAMSERLTGAIAELLRLGERWPMAIAGAGASAAVAARLPVRRLEGDPVTAAHAVSVER